MPDGVRCVHSLMLVYAGLASCTPASTQIVSFSVGETASFVLHSERVGTPSWLLHCEDDDGAVGVDVVEEMSIAFGDRWSTVYPPELPTPYSSANGFPELRLPTPDVARDDVAHCLVVFAADTWQVQSVDVGTGAGQDLAFDLMGGLRFNWNSTYVDGW